LKFVKKKSNGYSGFGGYGYGYWFDMNRGGIFWKFSKFMKRYNDLLNRYNGSETVQRIRGCGYGYGRRAAAGKRVRVQQVFSKKKTDRRFTNPYSFTRLYPDTSTGCTRRVLANPYFKQWSRSPPFPLFMAVMNLINI
jgi:hypothetical protein